MEKILALPFLVMLGMFIGPGMFLKFSVFSVTSKVMYCLFLLGAFTLIFVGFRQRKSKKGRIMILAGIILWALCGLAGLSTGT